MLLARSSTHTRSISALLAYLLFIRPCTIEKKGGFIIENGIVLISERKGSNNNDYDYYCKSGR